MTLASDRGLDVDATKINLYRSVVHHAAIADIVATAIRKPTDIAWIKPDEGSTWNSSCLMEPNGNHLRRFLAVSNWNEERSEHELRSWHGLGEVCILKMPMQLIIANIGQQQAGRRRSFWSRGLMHPQKSSLRFRKKSRASIEGFKESWQEIFREEHDEISRERWLQSLLDDDVLQEILFVIEIPVPGELEREKIRDMGLRKLDAISKLAELPEKQLSTCDGPLAPCPYRQCCWGPSESLPTVEIFDAVS